MIKVKKFEVDLFGKKELVSEVLKDLNGLVQKEVLFKDNKLVSISTKFYDNSQNLIEDRLEENGITSHKYKYDDNNKVIKEEVYFGELLYEKVLFMYKDDEVIEKTIIQDGDVVEKMKREINGNEVK